MILHYGCFFLLTDTICQINIAVHSSHQLPEKAELKEMKFASSAHLYLQRNILTSQK